MKKVLRRLLVSFSIISVSMFFVSCATTAGGSGAVLLVIATVTGGIKIVGIVHCFM